MSLHVLVLNVLKMRIFGANRQGTAASIISSNELDNEQRRNSLSHRYYTASFAETPVTTTNVSDQPYVKRYSTKQSQPLPQWIVDIISHSLAVHPTKSPVLGTIIHILSFTSALMFIVTFFWVRTYEIMSPKTTMNILQGSITVLIALIWTALGMYAKSLAKRLFRYPRFVKDVRMHSRTIFKINAAFLTFLLGLIFIITNDVDTVRVIKPKTCDVIELPDFVCWMYFVSKVVFSTLSLIWNTLIAIILISTCRTHTIGLRRFIKELEEDALLYDNMNCGQYKEHPMLKEDVFGETNWLEEEQSLEEDQFVVLSVKQNSEQGTNIGQQSEGPIQTEESNGNTCLIESHATPETKKRSRQGSHVTFHDNNADNFLGYENEVSDSIIDKEVPSPTNGVINPEMRRSNDEHNECTDPESLPSCSSASEVELRTLPDVSLESNPTPYQRVPPRLTQMSSEEILHKYWKISCRLRASSCIFQRWLASLIALIIIWSVTYLLHWQYDPADISDVVQFVIPLILLPLLCSAFAEVNLEGVRMVKCIFPIEERLPVLRFLQMNPLQMTLFNINLSYSTILTVVFAIFVAFTSRLIFTELQKT